MRRASLVLAFLLIVVTGRARAQGVGSLPTGPNETSGTVSLDSPSGSDAFDVTPGSEFSLNIDLSTSTGADAVHSLSFTLPTESFLTVEGIEASLPSGWTSSFANGLFSAQNDGGSDIPGGQSGLIAELVLGVTSDAPIGARLTLPSATNVEILNDDGIETVLIVDEFSLSGPTVVAAPEPRGITLGCLALAGLALLRWRNLRLAR